MIQISIYRDAKGRALGFCSRGHAEFDDPGRDIVCAAVSCLELNLANSVSALTDAEFSCDAEEENGEFRFHLSSRENSSAALLLDSCLLGLKSIEESYGGRYITITENQIQT